MATFNYATKDGGLFDQKINQGLLTSALGQDGLQFVDGARSFKLTTLTTGGLKPHTRDKGFNSIDVMNDKKIYTMGQDRDAEIFLDRQDVDETNQDLAVANLTNIFVTEHVQPELDAYRFSKIIEWAKALGDNKHYAEEALDESNVYTRLKAAILPIRKYNPSTIIGFVSSQVMDALERSKEFTRQITNQNVGLTALESRVTSIDGITLVEVWDDQRFHATYDFSDGFKPTGAAINFAFVSNTAIIRAVKESAVFLFAPGEHSQGDGWLYQNRLYHDIFLRDALKDGLSASVLKEAAPAGGK
ncbi:MAG: hypothetical protein ABF743_10935 [Schleiferilactobacillus perolens]|uniref:hypothetical protein n=1 Tax=Schleiferilactobacillus perolens TaxID=100468 RepID=UPI0039EB80E8